jgi:hypothetical protein
MLSLFQLVCIRILSHLIASLTVARQYYNILHDSLTHAACYSVIFQCFTFNFIIYWCKFLLLLLLLLLCTWVLTTTRHVRVRERCGQVNWSHIQCNLIEFKTTNCQFLLFFESSPLIVCNSSFECHMRISQT